VDARQVRQVRELLAGSAWVRRAGGLANTIASGKHDPGGLLLVGTPDDEPWHLGAHLSDEARWAGAPRLSPTWVRWAPPPGAPPHLSVGLQRLEHVQRGETLFVATPTGATAPLLERVSDARKIGALVVAMEGTQTELQDLAHDGLVVPQEAPVSYDIITHLVSMAAGEAGGGRPQRRLRGRLARLLDTLSGPADQ
jgi:hypothetical protein